MHLYGTFQEKGYTFESYVPDSDAEPIAFELRVLVGNELKHTLLAPMLHAPIFGVDVDDVRELESATDRLISLLPEADKFSERTGLALDNLEEKIGGKSLREFHARRLAARDSQSGQVQYKQDLFVEEFGFMLGGRTAAEQWTTTKQPQLGGVTPEEALRLGMNEAVFKCVHDIAERTLFAADKAPDKPPDSQQGHS